MATPPPKLPMSASPPPGAASAHILVMEINFSWEEILLYMTHLRGKQILLSITFKFARNRDKH